MREQDLGALGVGALCLVDAQSGQELAQQAWGLGDVLALEHSRHVANAFLAMGRRIAVDAAEHERQTVPRQCRIACCCASSSLGCERSGRKSSTKARASRPRLGPGGVAAMALDIHLEDADFGLRQAQRLAQALQLAVGPAPG